MRVMAEFKVTVYCLTYNHESYIRDTLDGFVNQKTNFKFRVIVHDDASTDGTPAIVKEYQERYPEIIFPIFQKENKYSKGVKIFQDIILPMIDTEYTAVCEGDDFWIDQNKLQLQYDFLMENPEYSLCVHNTDWMNSEGEIIGSQMINEHEDRDLSSEEIIKRGTPICHTSSFMYRTKIRNRMNDQFMIKGIGDYPLLIYLSTQGRVRYIATTMSIYHIGVHGGWTQRTINSKNTAVAHYQSVIDGLQQMDEATDYRYTSAFQNAIAILNYKKMRIQNKWLTILTKADIRKQFMNKSIKQSARTIIQHIKRH